MLFFSSASFAFEVFVHDGGPSAKTKLRVVKPVYPRATAADVMCGKLHHMARFRLNETYAGLPFSIIAKKMTRIKIRWDHPKQVLFPYKAKKKDIVFPHAGGVSRLYFRAYQPVSGNIYIMDDHDVVIKKCPYSFLPAKHYSQSVNFNVNETQYDRGNHLSDSTSNHYSVNYRISPKTVMPSGGNWSVSAGFSQSQSSTDSRQMRGSFSYSW